LQRRSSPGSASPWPWHCRQSLLTFDARRPALADRAVLEPSRLSGPGQQLAEDRLIWFFARLIATTSVVPGSSEEEKWKFIHDGLSQFAGRTLPLNEEVYVSASATNFRNRGMARLL